MENIFDYIEDNGNYLFEEKEFNSIDALILSTISYVEFDGIIENKRNYISLSDALEKFISNCDYKGFVSRGFVNKEVFKLARYLINKKRYKECIRLIKSLDKKSFIVVNDSKVAYNGFVIK